MPVLGMNLPIYQFSQRAQAPITISRISVTGNDTETKAANGPSANRRRRAKLSSLRVFFEATTREARELASFLFGTEWSLFDNSLRGPIKRSGGLLKAKIATSSRIGDVISLPSPANR